ncbi:replication initiation factor domain-containing protein [Enterococcus sp. UD-01]|jgi:phage replication initiation protein|uniref:replication initiation factor domain-containing protein n=1 Tax=Enterococcus sp. UD-01 TaxID=3373911 RepID=UPI0038373212
MHSTEIKQLRKQLKLTQQVFANQLGIPRNYLSMIETGKRTPPASLITKIREVFHLDGGILPMEAKIDFLRVRFKIDSPERVIEKVLKMDFNYFGYKSYGFNHYTETYFFSEIFVFFNPANLDMGVMIELRGQGCREYELILEEQQESWSQFFWRLYQDDLFGHGLRIDTKITRIDIALDELESLLLPNYDLYALKAKYEQGLVDTTFRNFDYKGGFLLKNKQLVNKGLSLYFGSKQSPFYMNFYQKDYELAKKEEISVEMARQKYGIINRYEVRLADEKAYLFVEYLLSTGETLEWAVKELIDTSVKVFDCNAEGVRTGYSLEWRCVIESMQELRLTVRAEKPSYDKALRWLSNYLAPTLKKIWLIDQALGKNELMERIQQAELKEKDKKEIQEITTTIRELLLQDTFEEDEKDERLTEQIIIKQEEIEQLLAHYLFD